METTATKPFFIVRFFRWLFSWRIMRRLLLTVAILATLWALFHLEENWRGKRAWQKYKTDLAARGEHLDLEWFIPKPIPDDQNFAAIPFFQMMFPKPPTNDSEW